MWFGPDLISPTKEEQTMIDAAKARIAAKQCGAEDVPDYAFSWFGTLLAIGLLTVIGGFVIWILFVVLG